MTFDGSERVPSARSTGKALDHIARHKGHDVARKDFANTRRFYFIYRGTWVDLRWYVSLALTKDKLSEASRLLVYNTETTHRWIMNKTTSTSTQKYHPADTKKINLLCYLSELLDDLMCDPTIIRNASESTGFESFFLGDK